MAHWVRIDENNFVVESIVTSNESKDEGFSWLSENLPGTWLKTSYNTLGGIHYDPETRQPSDDQSKAFRGNYASIGFVYDPELDVFYAEKPFESWVLNTTTFQWEAPEEMPSEGGPWVWNESSLSWVQFPGI